METGSVRVIDELKRLSKAYEKALMENDVPALEAFFRDSSDVVRLGPTENLFGADEINEFRRKRSSVGLERNVTRVECLALDDDHGVTHVCFERNFRGEDRVGRQTQVWKRFAGIGWKIVSAHVSFMERA